MEDKRFYDLTDAFVALNQVSDDEVADMIKTKKPVREGKEFSLFSNSAELEEAKQFLEQEEVEIEVIDPNADSIEHIKKKEDYIGQAILRCNKCMANKFINLEDLVSDENDSELYNVEDECPACHSSGSGFEMIGQVGKVVNDVADDEGDATPDTEVEADAAEIDQEENVEDEIESDLAEDETEEESDDGFGADTLSFEIEDEKDGMETETSEDDDIDDLDIPELGDETDEDVEEDDTGDVKESLHEDVQHNSYSREAWLMGKTIQSMNNEEAYFSGWLYIWPDGETEEECKYDFGDAESFNELRDSFERIYKRYHADGLYGADDETIEYAHKQDQILGLRPIDVLSDHVQEVLTEAFIGDVTEQVFAVIIDPENIERVVVTDVSDGKSRSIYDGSFEDLPVNVRSSQCSTFDVADGHLVCNIDTEDPHCLTPLGYVLNKFSDDKTDKISIWDQATGDEKFNGTKADAIELYGNCAFISLEAPKVIRLYCECPELVSRDELEEIPELSDKEELVSKIIKENNLSEYRVDKPASNEYWIKSCINESEDLELIYESFVKPTQNRDLIKEFKLVTGYQNALDEAYEAGYAAAMLNEDKEVEAEEAAAAGAVKNEQPAADESTEDAKPTEACSNTRSFKTRKELSEAIEECKNNNRPYTIRRSKLEGYRYDLVEDASTDYKKEALMYEKIMSQMANDNVYDHYWTPIWIKFSDKLHKLAASDLADIRDEFSNLYKKFHAEGLTAADSDVVAACKKLDKELDLPAIENNKTDVAKKEALEEDVEDATADLDTITESESRDVVPAGNNTPVVAVDKELGNKLMRISSDIAEAIEHYYDLEADPRLIVADILQDLGLIAGAIKPEDLDDTPINQLTKQMYASYETFYEVVDDMLTAVTGTSIETTPEQKLAQAVEMLDSPAFSKPVIEKAIASTKFMSLIRSGQVPYINAARLPELHEEYSDDRYCDVCGKFPCECDHDESHEEEDVLLESITEGYDEVFNDLTAAFEARGYDLADEYVQNYIESVVEYIADSGLSVEEWFKETEVNYPEDLGELKKVDEEFEFNPDDAANDARDAQAAEYDEIEDYLNSEDSSYGELFNQLITADNVKTEGLVGELLFRSKLARDLQDEFYRDLTDAIKAGDAEKAEELHSEFVNDLESLRDKRFCKTFVEVQDEKLAEFSAQIDALKADNEDELVDVDMEQFEAEINEYFNEAYEDTVLFTATNGSITDSGEIILEGFLTPEGSEDKAVEFKFTPMTALNESLSPDRDMKEALSATTYKVSNNISNEVFTFEFNK